MNVALLLLRSAIAASCHKYNCDIESQEYGSLGQDRAKAAEDIADNVVEPTAPLPTQPLNSIAEQRYRVQKLTAPHRAVLPHTLAAMR